MPPQSLCDPKRLQTHYVAGIHVLLMDGSARLVTTGVSATTWARAIVPGDGFVLGDDF